MLTIANYEMNMQHIGDNREIMKSLEEIKDQLNTIKKYLNI